MFFYTVGVHKETGKMKVFESQYDFYLDAKYDLINQCDAAGYVMGKVIPYRNKQRQGEVLTKNIQKQRREGTLSTDLFSRLSYF